MEAITLKTAVNDSVQAGAKILKGEFHLAKGEAKKNLQIVKKQTTALTIAAVVGAVGALYALAFIFAGLGKLLGDNYWLSGLILFAVCAGVAAVIGLKAWKELKKVDYKLPITRMSLDQQRDILPGFVKTFVNRTEQGLAQKRMERHVEGRDITPPPIPPELEMTVGRSEVAQGRDQWVTAVREFESLFRRFVSTEKEVEKVVREGARGAAYVLPVVAIAYLGYWIAGLRNPPRGNRTITI